MAGKKLVIVESPAKAKTIGKYLGGDFDVHASVGHVRDLVEPKNLPADKKHGSLGKFSVDVEHGFEPYYVVSPEKKKTVAELKKYLADADELFLATDGDREGEAIAWHLLQVLKPKVPVHRMVFHEITKEAIEEAKEHTRDIDTALVDAQETRRILDRLYGYEVSPVLWRKVGPGLSAGRVQSAATRLVVDRERERIAFVPAGYWDVQATLASHAEPGSFEARLTTLNGQRVATGRDFDDRGNLKGKALQVTEAQATELSDTLTAGEQAPRVAKVDAKPYRRSPAAPFTTSTLQQEAGRKLRFTARQTMSYAQSLYENGYITYMRTDSTALSQQAIDAARSQARELFGADSVPDKPRVYRSKAKSAQEAHEAIRPAGSTFQRPSALKGTLPDGQLKLYTLIWQRTVASQMADATGSTATATIEFGPTPASGLTAGLTASGTVITFRGFLDAYEESAQDDRHAADRPKEGRLPRLEAGQSLKTLEAEAKKHETTPPPRYTEASLVKALEELGIGRPSTYAAIISTIIDRGYVSLKGQALVPNWVAFSVVKLLEEHFKHLVDYDFTAEMEEDLDTIAAGKRDRVDWLGEFYFGGDGQTGLRTVIDNLGEIDAREINSRRITDTITLRIGKYGPYLETPGENGEPRRVNLPEDLAPDELTPEKAQELIDKPVVTDRVLGLNPDTGHEVVAKDGRFGPYVTEVLPDGETWPKGTKAPTASLFKSMSLDTIDLDTALKLLGLPRVVGEDPETGETITAQNGRFGPYLKRGSDSRSLQAEDEIFTVTLAQAQELYKQPKYGRRAASASIKEFGDDPTSGKPIKLKDGRFGPYVTDGTTNATIPKAETPEDVTFERAVELLAIKRAKGPAKPRAKSTAKRTTKSAAKSKSATTSKAAAKKTTKK